MTYYPLGEQLAQAIPLGVIGEQFTVDELDKHPDAKRIWRTIQEVVLHYENLTSEFIYTQDELDSYGNECYNEGVEEGERSAQDECYDEGYETGYKEGYDKGWTDGRNSPVPDNY